MIVRFLKNSWFHILIWIMLFIYFFSAPSLFVSVFAKNGKPLQDKITIPAESDHITLMIDGLAPYVKGGENLYNLYGWAFIIPQGNASTDLFIRELVLVSNERKYLFSVRSKYRNPELLYKFTDLQVDLDTLGFNILIAEDVIKPGKYRIGIIFRNVVDDSAFYCDKPVRYLIKTPNTLSLERK